MSGDTKTVEEILIERGWKPDGSGTYIGPGGLRRIGDEHVHGPSCTVESCGKDAMLFCGGGYCTRASRADGRRREVTSLEDVERRPCAGHYVPSRERLVKYALERKGLAAAAPPGTPLKDEEVTNTWSSERDTDVARARKSA